MKVTLIVFLVLGIALAKPIYDIKKSYITNLTPFNYNDQVSKYRQNTHYVSVVQFYKYSGTIQFMQMANQLTLLPNLMCGTINLEGFLKQGQSIVTNILLSVRKKESLSFPPSGLYPLILSQ